MRSTEAVERYWGLCFDFICRNAVFCWTALLAALAYYNVNLSQLVLLF
jgi:hypothetical protein